MNSSSSITLPEDIADRLKSLAKSMQETRFKINLLIDRGASLETEFWKVLAPVVDLDHRMYRYDIETNELFCEGLKPKDSALQFTIH